VKPRLFWAFRLIDFELETAFITTDACDGEMIPINEAKTIFFGMVLNDWSARGQKWEYVRTLLGKVLHHQYHLGLLLWMRWSLLES
jgi:2-keto-4-pentenoate hydratase/2-oxohepta-3-ene-1,7-dioic acid hydratase in catechol pathway